MVTLSDVTESIDYGLTASALMESSGPRFLRITDIQDDQVDWTTVPTCDCDWEKAKKYALKGGDLVFARTGATTGKSFLIRDCPGEAVFASYLIRVRPKPNVDPVFLARYFQTTHYWQQISKTNRTFASKGD